jgi:hypothetical protein
LNSQFDDEGLNQFFTADLQVITSSVSRVSSWPAAERILPQLIAAPIAGSLCGPLSPWVPALSSQFRQRHEEVRLFAAAEKKKECRAKQIRPSLLARFNCGRSRRLRPFT